VSEPEGATTVEFYTISFHTSHVSWVGRIAIKAARLSKEVPLRCLICFI